MPSGYPTTTVPQASHWSASPVARRELVLALPPLCATCLKRASVVEILKRLPLLDGPEVHEVMEIIEESFGSGASSSCSQGT